MKNGFARLAGLSLAAFVIGAGPTLAADPSTTSGQTQSPASSGSSYSSPSASPSTSGSPSGGSVSALTQHRHLGRLLQLPRHDQQRSGRHERLHQYQRR